MVYFRDFKDLIPKALQTYKVGRQARAALICHRFRDLAPDLLGEEAMEHVRVKFYKNHTIYVRVPNSLWAQRVYVHRHDLLMKINLSLETGDVREIRTVVELEDTHNQL